MSLRRDEFGAFFAALHDGHQPFRWQERLLDAVLADGWPEVIDAPTGAGKTAAIDMHIFALALAAHDRRPLPPRRLAIIVGRRVLVDSQHEHARRVAAALADLEQVAVVRRVAEQLWTLHVSRPDDHEHSPLLVARLRGGQPPSRRWADHPTAPAVLCATPDMFGSRLLFRGYGSAPRAWPREAGLLAVDTVALVDEAHLAQQLLRTARRVGELVGAAERPWSRALQVVETTATPSSTAGGRPRRSVGVSGADLVEEAALRARLSRPKPVTVVPVRNWAAAKPRPEVAQQIAGHVAKLRSGSPHVTVGCFVNTVARAISVAAALRQDHGLSTVLLCGQVRPVDVALLERDYPGLLSVRGNDGVDVVVSTQTLEVGVDLDLGGIVTELASRSALTQRAGRVNRLGARPTGRVVVIGPDGPLRTDARSGPYEASELQSAADWIAERSGDPMGLAPWALRTDPSPAAVRRTLLQRPELGQAWIWSRTSDDLADEPELDLWLSDDLQTQATVGLVVRHDLPEDPTDAVELIKVLRPRRHETFSVPINTLRSAVQGLDGRLRRNGDEVRGVLARGDDIGPIAWTDTDDGRRPRLRPGDVVVLDDAYPLFTAPAGAGDRRTPQVVVPAGDEVHMHSAPDVLEALALLPEDLRPGEVAHRVELTEDAHSTLREALTPDEDQPALNADAERVAVLDWLRTRGGPTGMATHAAALLETAPRQVDLIVPRAEGVPLRVLIVDARRATADEYVRQEWTPSGNEVTLERHQAAVAERAAHLASLVGLSPELTDVLRLAGAHHDDGKADPRFQIRLGARGQTTLAKSTDGAGPETLRRRADRSGLPPGWRHEQRSVADAWSTLDGHPERELIARLIGTSHGHGRTWFPHTAAELLHDADDPNTKQVATLLFDEGGWDSLIERTEQRYGAWVCAYLEAILRAADGQISAEGR
ncbi:type I-G CRISPR-associated helicase/endonuclease Cas3g [Pseudonocardia sp.]|uniref:type I-G CRISPR-associated helicase/endonuclease Cas3g n=1 Tax=Pseudonocardia sp. TaxID=60912 RepID=UPI003D10352B